MNWIYNHKRALLHVNLAFIGGLTGAYAILVRGGLEVLEVNHQGEWVSVTARKN